MNTKQIKYVLALAREGSFSRAAELLGISQPSLSQYIKKIEKEAGIEKARALVKGLTDKYPIYPMYK